MLLMYSASSELGPTVEIKFVLLKGFILKYESGG